MVDIPDVSNLSSHIWQNYALCQSRKVYLYLEPSFVRLMDQRCWYQMMGEDGKQASATPFIHRVVQSFNACLDQLCGVYSEMVGEILGYTVY